LGEPVEHLVAPEADHPAMTVLSVSGRTPEEIEERWRREVYLGDRMPQLTFRAMAMGAVLGFVMCLSNLYVGLKTGWGLGVAITAAILSYAIYGALTRLSPRLFGGQLSILENNAMASCASSAGYSTGGTMISATAAYLIVNGVHIAPGVLLLWTFFLSALGVFFAVPLKRQMINVEQLRFPTGTAAAVTLRSLYAKGQEATRKARALGWAAGLGAAVAFARDGVASVSSWARFALPGYTAFPGSIRGIPAADLTFSFENGLIMIGAGALIGLRVGISLLVGAAIAFGVLAPEMVRRGVIHELGYRGIVSYTLWIGVSLMVASSLVQFALEARTMARAFHGLGAALRGTATADPLARIEVPGRWVAFGVGLLSVGTVATAHVAFGIPYAYGLLAVALSFVLCIVACRATGETDTTPIGALGKVTQLTYGVLIPQNMTANLMTASITGNTATSSADLLTDLKSGYLLGANPRKQFLAQLFGSVIGTLVIVPFFYLLVPDPSALGGDRFPAPAAQVWASVAKLLSQGLASLSPEARWGMLAGAVVGVALPLLDRYGPKGLRRWLPSATGLGLAFVLPAWNSISMFLGAAIAEFLARTRPKTAEAYVIPVSSGLIAGESVIGIFIALAASLGILR
jgi:uncharacterized oligopeptide transporter (OPT) family protein